MCTKSQREYLKQLRKITADMHDKQLRIILKTKREHLGYLPSQFQYLSEPLAWRKGVGA